MDLSSKTAIVTGATSGIGKEAARVLAKRGAHVILVVRDVKRGETARAEILIESPTARVDVMHLELSSLKSVREFVEGFRAQKLPLNILLNNIHREVSGLSRRGGGNILPLITLTTAQENGVVGRIVNVASDAYRFTYKQSLMLDKLNDPKSFYGPKSYGQSKLANILHAKELTSAYLVAAGKYFVSNFFHLKEEGANVTANALHPGCIETGLGSMKGYHVIKRIFFIIAAPFAKSIPQGAGTSCYVATSPALNGVSGQYFQD